MLPGRPREPQGSCAATSRLLPAYVAPLLLATLSLVGCGQAARQPPTLDAATQAAKEKSPVVDQLPPELLQTTREAKTTALLSRIAGTRIVTIADGDFTAHSYSTGQLAPKDAGFRDHLTVIELGSSEPTPSSLEVSNSVVAPPEVLELSPDGKTAFVVERLTQRSADAVAVSDLAPGSRLFAVDLTVAGQPRLAATAEVAAAPEALSLSPDGTQLAVISNGPTGSQVQLVSFTAGAFGPVRAFELSELVAPKQDWSMGRLLATNIHWHPSGKALAVNITDQNRIVFMRVQDQGAQIEIEAWGAAVEVDRDPFVGRFTPDGKYYITSNWGRNLKAKSVEERLPSTPSQVNVIQLAPWGQEAVAHRVVSRVASDRSAEGIAISPDGSLVATVNMRGTALRPGTDHFDQYATVTLLSLDNETGQLRKLGDYLFEGVLPEGGTFDSSGEHFLATVFQGHAGSAPSSGPGLEIFEVIRDGADPALQPLGRIPLAHGVHQVRVAP